MASVFTLRRVVSFLAMFVAAFSLVVVFNALAIATRQLEPGAALPLPELDESALAARLARGLSFPTISARASEDDTRRAFDDFVAHIDREFPRVHSRLERETIHDHALLFRWPGTDQGLSPVLLMGHFDVVPVEPGTESLWSYPPFAGVIAEGHIWGRGALDDKVSVLGTLEAAEHLLTAGFRPRRTIYLAFGHDEEMGGRRGAAAIARRLQERGVRLGMVLDEGGVVSEGSVPGLEQALAVVGIAEKGYASFELAVTSEGGHSSMPPRQTAVGILAAALTRLEAQPMVASIDGATREMFETVAPELPFSARAGLANLWLFEPIVIAVLESDPATNALVRTTTAITVIEGGTKDNVLPSRVRAVVNFRILPGDTVESVRRRMHEIVDDSRIEVVLRDDARDPSRISPTDHEGYRALSKTIRRRFANTVVAPYLVVAGTDGRWFEPVADAVYRFLPVRLQAEDRHRIHGSDERISVADYANAVRFYIDLMQSYCE